MGLKGLKADKKPLPVVYLAAFNFEDFMEFTGGSGFRHDTGKYKGKIVADTEDERFVFCQFASDIRGLQNIRVAYTEKYNVKRKNEKKKEFERELEICNFNSNQYIDFDILPNTIKEMMKE